MVHHRSLDRLITEHCLAISLNRVPKHRPEISTSHVSNNMTSVTHSYYEAVDAARNANDFLTQHLIRTRFLYHLYIQ